MIVGFGLFHSGPGWARELPQTPGFWGHGRGLRQNFPGVQILSIGNGVNIKGASLKAVEIVEAFALIIVGIFSHVVAWLWLAI